MMTNTANNTHRMAARIFGILFLITFLSYGFGTGLATSVVTAPEGLANLSANGMQLIIGALLMAVVHTVANIGLPVVMLPFLKPTNKHLAYGYLSSAIAATVVLVVGAVFLLLMLPLSDAYAQADAASASYFETLGMLFERGNFFSYQIGMALWGIGGLMFCVLLYQSRLVPRWLTVWGFIGYIIFVAGTVLELFGYNIGVTLSMPGGLFEIFLSVWLIAKGFNASAIVSETVGRPIEQSAPVRIPSA